MRKNLGIGVASLLVLFSPLATAQQATISEVSMSGHFFTSVIAGVVIAVGIQFLLSNLAVALGISAVGDLRKSDDNTSKSDDGSHTSWSATSKKVISAMGVFTTLTMSISLFAGTWLALDLAQSATVLNGAITGLVIWALFFMVCLYFDIKLTTSITGRLVDFIQASISKTGSILSGAVTSSNQPKPQEFAEQTVKAIHDEIRQEFDVSDIDKKIKNYIDRASSDLNATDLRKEMEKLLHEIEIEEQYNTDDPDAARKLILEVANKQSSVSSQDKQKFKDAVGQAKSALREGGDSNQAKATAVFDKLSPGNDEQGQNYRKMVSDYLDNMGKEEVSSEQIEQDLEKIFNNPKDSQQVIKGRFEKIDRDTITAAIAAHPDMDETKANKVVAIFDKVANKFAAKSSSVSTGNENSNQGSELDNLPVKRSKAETRVQQWFDRMNRPELRYRNLKGDFMEILDNPKIAPSVLSKRLSKMDEKSVRALLTNNSQLDESDIDQYMERFTEAKSELISRVNQLQEEATNRINALQDSALKQSEYVRQSAMAAAWWLFISATVSGAAALVAGALAANII